MRSEEIVKFCDKKAKKEEEELNTKIEEWTGQRLI